MKFEDDRTLGKALADTETDSTESAVKSEWP